jgi:hypothetical protein
MFFLGRYLRWKVKKCDRKIFNVLQAFHVCRQFIIRIASLTCSLQAALAFNQRFSHCAERIEVRLPFINCGR